GRNPDAGAHTFGYETSGMDGLELLKRIRSNERTKILPIVVFTSSESELGIMRSYKLNANSYVIKPVDSEKFFKVVQQ
ncbi:MAG: response regulator, partial [Candidatus Thorarchaeota archaeon]